MKICSIDQSTKISGVSTFIDNCLTEYGTLVVQHADKLNSLQRIREMYFLVSDYLDQQKPDFVALEQIQFQNNYSTFQQLAQMQGAILAAIFERDIPCAFCESTRWKAYNNVVGKKREQQKLCAIQRVKEIFDIDANSDESDSILQGKYYCENLKSEEL